MSSSERITPISVEKETVSVNLTLQELSAWYRLGTQDIANTFETREFAFFPVSKEAPKVVAARLVNKTLQGKDSKDIELPIEAHLDYGFFFTLPYDKAIYQALKGENGHYISFEVEMSSEANQKIKNGSAIISSEAAWRLEEIKEFTSGTRSENAPLDPAYDDPAMYVAEEITQALAEGISSILSKNNELGRQILVQAVQRGQDTLDIRTNLYQLKIAAMTSHEQLGFTAEEVQGFIDELSSANNENEASLLQQLSRLGVTTIKQIGGFLINFQSREITQESIEPKTEQKEPETEKLETLELIELSPERKAVLEPALPLLASLTIEQMSALKALAFELQRKIFKGSVINAALSRLTAMINQKPESFLITHEQIAKAGATLAGGKRSDDWLTVKLNKVNVITAHDLVELVALHTQDEYSTKTESEETNKPETEKVQVSSEKAPETSEEPKTKRLSGFEAVSEAAKENPALLEMNMTQLWFYLLELAGLAYPTIPEDEIDAQVKEAAKDTEFRNAVFVLSETQESTTVGNFIATFLAN